MGSNYSRPRSLEDVLGRPIVLNTMSQWISETKELSKKPLLMLRILKATRAEITNCGGAKSCESNIEQKCFEMELSLAKRYARVISRTRNQDLITLFRRYLRIAVVCKEIAKWINYPELEMAFFAGLSHNIGKLVIGLRNARALKEIRNLTNKGLATRDAENIILGFEHSELGARLLEKWGMPEALIEMTRYHLIINKVSRPYKQLALILGLSKIVVRSLRPRWQPLALANQASSKIVCVNYDWSKVKSYLKKLNIKKTFEEWNQELDCLQEEIKSFEAGVFV